MTRQVLATAAFATAGLALAVVGSSAAHSQAVSNYPCRTAPDTTARAVASVAQDLSASDSAGVVAAGIPFQPAHVTAVSDSTTCQHVVDAYNALVASTDSTRRITSGFVVSADSAFALYVPASRPKGPATTLYFTAGYVFGFMTTDVD